MYLVLKMCLLSYQHFLSSVFPRRHFLYHRANSRNHTAMTDSTPDTPSPAHQTGTAAPGNGIRPFLRHWRARFIKRWARHMIGIDREETSRHVQKMGELTPAYLFLVMTSCSIATLGLLLNSVAVIIGAMLIAPLMGPIILLGFAVARTDIEQGILAAKTLLVGVLVALASSWAIVTLSPFIAPTPEILARTQPNLFDLLVAVLSGLAGGYAVVRREVGTVAGVAIATALMPPLATAGYGLASGDLLIFDGAFFLFLTNMVAISFSAASVAAWYGLGNLHAPRELLWKTLAGLLVLAVLSLPLLRALDETVSRALTNKNVESILRAEGLEKSWQIGQINVFNGDDGKVGVSALVFVPEIEEEAVKRLNQRMKEQLGKPVHLELNQVLVGERKPLTVTLPAPAPVLPAPPVALTEREALQRYLKRYLGLPTAAVEIDAAASALIIQVGANYSGGLQTLRSAEARLAAALPKWKVALLPTQAPLPEIHFPENSAELDDKARHTVSDIAWALARWKIGNVRIEGASTRKEARKDKTLGLKRATALAETLKAEGIACEAAARTSPSTQNTAEQEYGQAAFRIAAVHPLPLPPP
jgi:uncharacterized hydrophobic protein (TIGR00271 family)